MLTDAYLLAALRGRLDSLERAMTARPADELRAPRPPTSVLLQTAFEQIGGSQE
jgi:hypothetical protein